MSQQHDSLTALRQSQVLLSPRLLPSPAQQGHAANSPVPGSWGLGRSQDLQTMHWCEVSWLGMNHSPKNITAADNQPRNGFVPLLSCTGDVSPCSMAKTSSPAPTFGPIKHHLGTSSKLCQAPVGPSLSDSYQLQQQYGIVLDYTSVSWQKQPSSPWDSHRQGTWG